MNNLNNLECSLLGILGSIAMVYSWRSCSLNWTKISFQNGSRSNLFCFGGGVFILILRTPELNVANGDTAPFSLNSWGFWENSEPSGLESSWWLLQDWIWMDGGVIKTSCLLVPWITNNNHKLRSPPGWSWKITNHKFPSHCKESSLQITNA